MSFDALAPHYRWMERVLAGDKLQRCRTEFLSKISPPKRGLLVGEGHGRFLTEFFREFPECEVTCVDASSKMLDAAQRALGSSGRVSFVHANIFEWKPPDASFDLVVTNFFLDCFTAGQIEVVVNKLSRAASENATWLLADFREPADGWKRVRARLILASMYTFFRFATKLPARRLASPDEDLRSQGFELIQRKLYDWDLLHSDLWRRRGGEMTA